MLLFLIITGAIKTLKTKIKKALIHSSSHDKQSVLSTISQYRKDRNIYNTSTAETNRKLTEELIAGTYTVIQHDLVLEGLKKQLVREADKLELIHQFNPRY